MAEKKKDKNDQILEKLGKHDQKFIEHDKQFVVITKKLEEHDKRFDTLEIKYDKKFNEILSGQDKIIKELEAAREDRVFAFAKDKEQDQRLNNLEDRMQKIEVKVS